MTGSYSDPASLSRDELRELLLSLVTEQRRARFEKVLRWRTRHLTVVVENLYQPHNASAVIRSCDCFGIQDIHIIENEHVFDPSENISLGSQKWVTQRRYNQLEHNTKACIQALRADGYRIVATTPHTDDQELHELSLDQPMALFFGSEKPGLTEHVLEEADDFVRIPMYGFTESFNISVSAALTLYDLTTRLHQSELNWALTEDEKNELRLEWATKSAPRGADIYARWLEGQH